MNEVLILGGYGNFGKRIAAALARHKVPVTIAGRDIAKAEALAAGLRSSESGAQVSAAAIDAPRDLDAYLQAHRPAAVVNTCGPFQNKDYGVAEACIRQRTHYIDLADGREFVTGITRLDSAAKAAGIGVISGASTVPALTSAVLDHYRGEFSAMDEVRSGISPGQKAERGLATTAAILSYVGRRLKPVPGDRKPRWGWQDLYRQSYPGLGLRWMANCDVPDLDLLPERFGLETMRFSAGMENGLVHFGLFGLSWLVRSGFPLDLPRHAPLLLRLSHLFDRSGSDDGGMHVVIRGKGLDFKPHTRSWFIVARDGDGPQIPCVPAILLAKRAWSGNLAVRGARPCVALVSLEDYLGELGRFAIMAVET